MEVENTADNTADKPVSKQEIRLVDVNISNENIALNVMVSFLTLAHKRGVFSIDESAKIYE